MKESGRMIRQREKGNSLIPVEMFMKGNGRMTKPMDMECINTRMGLNIKDGGNRMYNMGKE